jgi:hypothetical protein
MVSPAAEAGRQVAPRRTTPPPAAHKPSSCCDLAGVEAVRANSPRGLAAYMLYAREAAWLQHQELDAWVLVEQVDRLQRERAAKMDAEQQHRPSTGGSKPTLRHVAPGTALLDVELRREKRHRPRLPILPEMLVRVGVGVGVGVGVEVGVGVGVRVRVRVRVGFGVRVQVRVRVRVTSGLMWLSPTVWTSCLGQALSTRTQPRNDSLGSISASSIDK